MKYVLIILEWLKALLRSNPTPSMGEPSSAPSEPSMVSLNRSKRRQMVSVLKHHKDHGKIRHTDLPLSCSLVEYMYWVKCIEEVNKQRGES